MARSWRTRLVVDGRRGDDTPTVALFRNRRERARDRTQRELEAADQQRAGRRFRNAHPERWRL